MIQPKDVIKKYIQDNPAPARGLIIDTVEYPSHISIRMYRDNFNLISDNKQQQMVEWMEKMLKDINFHHTFNLTIEMEERVPNL
jgi:hypothetical protein